MAQPIGSAYAEIKLNQRGFNSQLGAMGTSFNRTGGNMMGMAKQISSSFLGMAGAAGAVIGAIKGVNAAVDKFVGFDTKLRNIWTLTDMTWEEMQKLGKEIQVVSARYGQLGEAGLDAMYQIYSAGFQGADGMELFEQALIGSLAGLTSVKQQADVLAAALNAYGWSVEKASYVNDVFFTIVKRGVTNASELGASFGRLTAIAAPLGVEFEELAGAIMTLTKSGINTAEAITSIRQSIVQLARPGEALLEVIKALGFETGQAMMDNIGWAESIAKVSRYAIENNLQLTDLFTNIRAIMAILPLATTQQAEFAEDVQAAADASGAAAEAADKQRGEELKLKTATAELDAAMKDLGETLGTVVDAKVALKRHLADFINDIDIVAERVGSLTGKINELRDAFHAFADKKVITPFLAIAQGLGLLMTGKGTEGAQAILDALGLGGPSVLRVSPPGGISGGLSPEQVAAQNLSAQLEEGFENAFASTFGREGSLLGLLGIGPEGLTMPGLGPTIAGAPTAPEAVLGPWTDAFDELAEALSVDPTGGVAAIRSFLESYGEIPAALLAGASASSAVLRDLEQLQTLGMGAFTDDIQWLEDFLGISAEQAKKLADEADKQAKRDTDKATRDAKTAADQAVRDAKTLAAQEARAAEEVFNRQFIDPIAKALRTGDWLGAAETISIMAGTLPEMIAAAEAIALKHDLDIENLDVLERLVGMEGMLVTALEARIKVAEDAKDFDLVTELKRQLGIIAPEADDETAVEKFQKKFDSMIDGVLRHLPSSVRELAGGMYRVVTDALSNPVDAIGSALDFVASVVNSFIGALEEKKARLEQALDTYINAYEAMGGLVGGGILGGAVQLLISSVRMLTLEGLDLVNEGMSSLAGFVNTLVGSFRRLISMSDASAVIQEESQTIWTAIGNLLGEFLWPVAAALRLVRQWLGIPGAEGGGARAGQVGVPSGFKMERLRYQAIAPGQKVMGDEDGVQIPAWAEPVGEALANAIMEVLASFGISSWTQLMEGARQVAQNVWAWISTRLPAMVTSAIDGISRVRQVLSDAGITWESIGAWLARGVDFIIAEFPAFAGKAATFFVNVSEAAASIVGLLGGMPTWDELNTAWDDFTAELENLDALPDIVTAIEGVETQIKVLKTVFAIVVGAAAGAIVGSLVAAFPWALIGLGIGGLLGGLGGAVLANVAGRAYHSGGIVQGPPGIEQNIRAMPGETVLPTHQPGFGLRPIVIPIMLDGRKVGEGMVKWATNEGWELTGHSGGGSGWTKRGT